MMGSFGICPLHVLCALLNNVAALLEQDNYIFSSSVGPWQQHCYYIFKLYGYSITCYGRATF